MIYLYRIYFNKFPYTLLLIMCLESYLFNESDSLVKMFGGLRLRSEKEMMQLILAKAADSENIRIVELNGSRVTGSSQSDPFQDYDIVYYVEDMDSFLEDHSWIDYFGTRIMMQMPDQMPLFPSDPRESFSYLMLFTDGNRIDLTLTPVQLAKKCLERNELRKILLDKDGIGNSAAMITEDPYRIIEPVEKEFHDCSNEFWWVSIYVAKALWREELPLAKAMMDGSVRNMLMAMMDWHVGVQTNFTVSTGKYGRSIEKYVDKEVWQKLLLTYPDSSYPNIWKALFHMCDLFEELSQDIGQKLNFKQPTYGTTVLPFLKHIEQLPKNSSTIYP